MSVEAKALQALEQYAVADTVTIDGAAPFIGQQALKPSRPLSARLRKQLGHSAGGNISARGRPLSARRAKEAAPFEVPVKKGSTFDATDAAAVLGKGDVVSSRLTDAFVSGMKGRLGHSPEDMMSVEEVRELVSSVCGRFTDELRRVLAAQARVFEDTIRRLRAEVHKVKSEGELLAKREDLTQQKLNAVIGHSEAHGIIRLQEQFDRIIDRHADALIENSNKLATSEDRIKGIVEDLDSVFSRAVIKMEDPETQGGAGDGNPPRNAPPESDAVKLCKKMMLDIDGIIGKSRRTSTYVPLTDSTSEDSAVPPYRRGTVTAGSNAGFTESGSPLSPKSAEKAFAAAAFADPSEQGAMWNTADVWNLQHGGSVRLHGISMSLKRDIDSRDAGSQTVGTVAAPHPPPSEAPVQGKAPQQQAAGNLSRRRTSTDIKPHTKGVKLVDTGSDPIAELQRASSVGEVQAPPRSDDTASGAAGKQTPEPISLKSTVGDLKDFMPRLGAAESTEEATHSAEEEGAPKEGVKPLGIAAPEATASASMVASADETKAPTPIIHTLSQESSTRHLTTADGEEDAEKSQSMTTTPPAPSIGAPYLEVETPAEDALPAASDNPLEGPKKPAVAPKHLGIRASASMTSAGTSSEPSGSPASSSRRSRSWVISPPMDIEGQETVACQVFPEDFGMEIKPIAATTAESAAQFDPLIYDAYIYNTVQDEIHQQQRVTLSAQVLSASLGQTSLLTPTSRSPMPGSTMSRRRSSVSLARLTNQSPGMPLLNVPSSAVTTPHTGHHTEETQSEGTSGQVSRRDSKLSQNSPIHRVASIGKQSSTGTGGSGDGVHPQATPELESIAAATPRVDSSTGIERDHSRSVDLAESLDAMSVMSFVSNTNAAARRRSSTVTGGRRRVKMMDSQTQASLGYSDAAPLIAKERSVLARERAFYRLLRSTFTAAQNLVQFAEGYGNELVCRECFCVVSEACLMWPCGHTFCYRCIEKRMRHDQEEMYVCATCNIPCREGHTPNHIVRQIANRWSFMKNSVQDPAHTADQLMQLLETQASDDPQGAGEIMAGYEEMMMLGDGVKEVGEVGSLSPVIMSSPVAPPSAATATPIASPRPRDRTTTEGSLSDDASGLGDTARPGETGSSPFTDMRAPTGAARRTSNSFATAMAASVPRRLSTSLPSPMSAKVGTSQDDAPLSPDHSQTADPDHSQEQPQEAEGSPPASANAKAPHPPLPLSPKHRAPGTPRKIRRASKATDGGSSGTRSGAARRGSIATTPTASSARRQTKGLSSGELSQSKKL